MESLVCRGRQERPYWDQKDKHRYFERRMKPMYETTTSPRVREGILRAHQERGEAVRKAFRWMIFRHV